MNHYPRHVGDFAAATAGLSLTERGAYNALLDQYYAHEKPLPLEAREVQRMAVAATKTERDAVDYVLKRFFVRQDDGWHQKRADEEIQAYRCKADKARENGQKGGRRKNLNGSDSGTNSLTNPVSERKANQNHNQNQEPTLDLRQASENQGAIAPLSGKPDERLDGKGEKLRKLRAEAVGIIEYLNLKTGRNYKPDGPNVEMVVALLKGGSNPAEIRQVIVKKSRQWKGDPKMDEYARPKTLFNRTNFAQYSGELVDSPEEPHSEAAA